MNLMRIADLDAHDIRAIWTLADEPNVKIDGSVGWSFEGNGIRTRTTFVQAFGSLNLSFVELPNILKTQERACDLAGYLDPFYDIYVIRESNHERLTEFASASQRPVVNAMSAEGHPCEVLSDAYFVERSIGPLAKVKVSLWGPPTNVLRSWHELARVLGFEVVHLCEARFHDCKPNVRFIEVIDGTADIVITDGWPTDYESHAWSLNRHHLESLGMPKLLPTPPFSIGRELAFDPLLYKGFVGYDQKVALLNVQKAILRYVISK